MHRQVRRSLLLILLIGFLGACRFTGHSQGGDGNESPNPGGGIGNGGNGGSEGPKNLVSFTPVGLPLGSSDLIDLEFLPGQNGEAIVISKSGTVFYLDSDLSPLFEIQTLPVEDGGERGLLNVAADPEYANNHYVYFYYTRGAISPDVNRVERYTVAADSALGTFSLSEPLLIIQFSKSQSPNPASNHNGGGLGFDSEANLLIGVGDGGGGASANQTLQISQDLELRLGKVHRIVPDREPFPTPTPTPGVEHFTVPAGQAVSVDEPSIYAVGFRNPFSLVVNGDDEVFVGDVGLNLFEEVDLIATEGENFGWPLCEGECDDPEFRDPLHGYAHDDESFLDADPFFASNEDPSEGFRSIVSLVFYTGPQYNGMLSDSLIYTDFYLGWVRALRDSGPHSDKHVGHMFGLTSLQTHPVDGFLYGVGPSISDKVLRMDVNP